LDLACGNGSYAIAAAAHIGPAGKIYGIDLWQAGIETLKREAADRGIHHIYGKIADLGRAIPLEDAAVDVCFIATALHDLVREILEDEEVIKKILKHLGLWEVKARPPPKKQSKVDETAIEYSESQLLPSDDYLHADPEPAYV
jgi:ubiquinone/menaquinone biosynthesis C-methylase UbiE